MSCSNAVLLGITAKKSLRTIETKVEALRTLALLLEPLQSPNQSRATPITWDSDFADALQHFETPATCNIPVAKCIGETCGKSRRLDLAVTLHQDSVDAVKDDEN